MINCDHAKTFCKVSGYCQMKYISTIFSLLPALRGNTINLKYESFKELFYLRMKTHVVEIHKVKEPFFT